MLERNVSVTVDDDFLKRIDITDHARDQIAAAAFVEKGERLGLEMVVDFLAQFADEFLRERVPAATSEVLLRTSQRADREHRSDQRPKITALVFDEHLIDHVFPHHRLRQQASVETRRQKSPAKIGARCGRSSFRIRKKTLMAESVHDPNTKCRAAFPFCPCGRGGERRYSFWWGRQERLPHLPARYCKGWARISIIAANLYPRIRQQHRERIDEFRQPGVIGFKARDRCRQSFECRLASSGRLVTRVISCAERLTYPATLRLGQR